MNAQDEPVNPIEALRRIRTLCNPMDAKFDEIRTICDVVLHQLKSTASTQTDGRKSK